MSDPNYPGGSNQPGDQGQQFQQNPPQQPAQPGYGQDTSGQMQNAGGGYPTQAAMPPSAGRPGTATASGVIAIVFGALGALGGLIAAIAGGGAAATSNANGVKAAGGVLVVLGVILLIVGVLELICGIMVLKRRNWARLTLTVLIVIGLISSIVQAVRNGNAATAIVSIVIDLGLLALLWVKPTTEWFKGAPTGTR